MTEHDPSARSPEFKDRRAGLVLFGVLQILIGAFCALMIPLMAASGALSQAGGVAMDARTMIPAILQYALMAVAGIWLGIGSIRARRWARALTLVLAWIWLVCGVLGLLFFITFMGDMYQQIAQESRMPSEAIVVMQVVMSGMLGCIYVFLPGMFILFYQSRHVRATCESRDPQVRWTDRCPLPVLAVSLLLGFGAFSTIGVLAYGAVVPWFGTLLSGVGGLGVMVANALLLSVFAWGIYKLKKWAWLGTTALIAILSVSAIMTFSRVSLLEMYEKMNFPEGQLELMQKYGMFEKMNFPWMMGICLAAYLAYLLYVGRYFVSSPSPGDAG
ncbi:MAG TPA: hypothetical protein VMY37_11290 [Thermoguttaceae bacterium]|nr:hypothetical protein [Thermoguttaceae bacterium]